MKGSAAQIAAYLRARAVRLRVEVIAAERASGEELFKTTRLRSTGSVTLAQMAAMGHPFARRHGAPLLDPTIIHYHVGRIWRGWRLQATVRVGDEAQTVVEQTDRLGVFMEGTKYMVRRAPQEVAAQQVEPHREARLDRALERTFW